MGDMDLDKSAFRLGNTQVFLRAGVLSHLDGEREDKLRDQVIRFQAVCRGYLARRQLQKLKTQDIAIRCIQKNVRKFMAVREWPWWRLLIKVIVLVRIMTHPPLKKCLLICCSNYKKYKINDF